MNNNRTRWAIDKKEKRLHNILEILGVVAVSIGFWVYIFALMGLLK